QGEEITSNMLLDILFILIGFALLVKGGDFLISGAVAIAQRAKLSPMVIGLTVIGFGTSLPELLVGSQAAWAGSSGLAIGNVAGSNIANVALILGATALIRPLPSSRMMLRIDVPFMLFAMVLFLIAAFTDGTITRWQGIAMTFTLVAFITWEILRSRRATKAAESAETTATPMPLWKALLLVAVSLAAMVWGADLLIDGSTNIAMQLGNHFGVNPKEMERIIGLTIVAVGTSLPELFASVIAARKGETDMAVGNIVGSVSFNILCVVGVSSAITPIQNAWTPFMFDYLVMLALGLVLLLFLRTKHLLERWEGAVLLLAYVLYIARTLYI
ncbi:MAG: calcium/sodium antiporter, partial [Bacteroidaceae bacterium]|nr:calcium/sodium antiporter [Bacteroidaceae bacterium]